MVVLGSMDPIGSPAFRVQMLMDVIDWCFGFLYAVLRAFARKCIWLSYGTVDPKGCPAFRCLGRLC